MAFAGGTGTAKDPYLVATAEQLNDVRNYLSSAFKQTANIDLSAYSDFIPIGNSDTGNFAGIYDGNGFVISNLKQSDSSRENSGLFGYASPDNNALVILKNITIENANIVCGGSSGILLGCGYANIAGCRTSGSIRGYGTLGGVVGMLLDYSDDYITLIENSSSTATITGADGSIGGVIGYAYARSVDRCYYAGYKVTGMYSVGGLAGYASGDTGFSITNCYATGIVASFDSLHADMASGGFVGSCEDIIVTNCYSACTIIKGGYNTFSSGFSGLSDYATVTSCYYDSGLTSYTDTVASAKSTADMQKQDTYTGWDFNNVWAMSDKGYPYLRNTPGAPIKQPTYYDRLAIGGMEIKLLNNASIATAMLMWLAKQEVKTITTNAASLDIMYADETTKTLAYTLDNLNQVTKVSDSSDSTSMSISWSNTEL